ncbi:protein BONZAI 3-like isoform X2 [Chenopodium quinoa]|uniref:protein BONZAI 3-like isoform X2 n=1 Tax=Chenopodium quinoa TaxID=63459 RepID=UPI000B78DCFF|nr:protein BONZAI 3-like isoform X2 [Chenopodium quinoa]
MSIIFYRWNFHFILLLMFLGSIPESIKKNANGTANEICTTELVKNNPKPEWSVYLNMQQIGGKGDELIIEGYNFSSNRNHTLFGTWQAPVSDLAKRNSEESSHGLKKNRNSQLSVDILESHSFLDFINNGYEIGLMVAVDFADVDPEGLDPFHIIDSSGNLNAYLQVLKDIGRAIEHYDSDRRFPAWCFGGKLTGKCCPASTWNRIQPIVWLKELKVF